jgi:GT2 family glycosyltransferase
MQIGVVIVTFNRKNLLLRAIDKVLSQSFPIKSIIVIDNASNDGTEKSLEDAGYINEHINDLVSNKKEFFSKSNEKVEIIYKKMAKNIGGAGGFHEGQRLAIDLKLDWVWMMDDDGFPGPETLKFLINAATKYDYGLLNPLVIDCDDNQRLSFGLNGKTEVKSIRSNSKRDYIIDNVANPFNGTLIKASLIKKVGLIKKEMFIWGDEKEYIHRFLKAKIKIGTLVNADFYHPKSKSIYEYAFFGLFSIEAKPIKLEMNLYRNIGYINTKYKSIFSHKYILRVILIRLLRFEFFKSWNSLKYYLDGCADRFHLPSILKD